MGQVRQAKYVRPNTSGRVRQGRGRKPGECEKARSRWGSTDGPRDMRGARGWETRGRWVARLGDPRARDEAGRPEVVGSRGPRRAGRRKGRAGGTQGASAGPEGRRERARGISGAGPEGPNVRRPGTGSKGVGEGSRGRTAEAGGGGQVRGREMVRRCVSHGAGVSRRPRRRSPGPTGSPRRESGRLSRAGTAPPPPPHGPGGSARTRRAG